MHFMLLIFVFLLWAVLWGFFHANPRGVDARWLLACNVAILALGVALALSAAIPLYADALAAKPDHKAIAIYLAVMAGGTGFMIIVSLGGLVRNLALFPLSRRGVDSGNNVVRP